MPRTHVPGAGTLGTRVPRAGPLGTGCLGPCPLVPLCNGRQPRRGRNCTRDDPRVTCGIVRVADVAGEIGGAVRQAEVYGAAPRFWVNGLRGNCEHAFGAGLDGHPRPRDKEKSSAGILCGRGKRVRIAPGGLVPFDSHPNSACPRANTLFACLPNARRSVLRAHTLGVCKPVFGARQLVLRTRALGSRHRIAPVLGLGPTSLVLRASHAKLSHGDGRADSGKGRPAERKARQTKERPTSGKAGLSAEKSADHGKRPANKKGSSIEKARRQAQSTQPIWTRSFGPFTRKKGYSRGELHICTRKLVEE